MRHLDYQIPSAGTFLCNIHLFILFFLRKEDHFEYFTILNDLDGELKSSASLKHDKSVKINVSRWHLNNCTFIMVPLIFKRLAVSGCYKWTRRCSSSFHNRPNWLMTHSPNTLTVTVAQRFLACHILLRKLLVRRLSLDG